MTTAYRLLRDRFGKPAGSICYPCRYHDYGLANDDTRRTGVEHWSMTLNSDGSWPSFTVPVHELEEITK